MIYQALPVPIETINGDEEGFGEGAEVPNSVSLYLQRVRAEAQKIPDIMIATRSNVQKEEIVVSPSIEQNDKNLSPPTGWERSVLADFAEVRHTLAVYRARGIGSKSYPRVSVPAMRDAPAWARFCFGSHRGRELEAQTENNDQEHQEDMRLPLTRLVLQLDSPMTQAVLRHHVKWAKISMQNDQALWLYALLARLELPLHRDLDCLLRTFVLDLLRHRISASSLDDDEEFIRLQLLLLLAGRPFGQATPAELDGTERSIGPTILSVFGSVSSTNDIVQEDEDEEDAFTIPPAARRTFSEDEEEENEKERGDFDWIESPL